MDQHIRQFDSFEEAMEALGYAEDAANTRATPTQQAIPYGAVVVKPLPDILIFGTLYTKEEVDDGEDVLTREMMADSHRRGYRFGKWHSELEPSGELGTSHISTLWPITRTEFECAQGVYFSMRKIVDSEWGRQMIARVHDEAGREMGAVVDEAGAGFVVVEEDPT